MLVEIGIWGTGFLPHTMPHKILPSELHVTFSRKSQCTLIIPNIFLQHKMNMLSAGICEDDDDDDDDFNKEYDDEEDDFGLEYLFVISKLQVTRKAKWAHQ